MENKNQHWVPKSYLKAWVDPHLPKGRKGQVWVYSKAGDSWETKSPNSIFSEPDFYTKTDHDCSRDLTLEKSLGTIENDFLTLRRKKLASIQDLTNEDILKIITFVSTMMYRTKLRRDKEKQRWSHVLQVMDDLAEQMKINPVKPLPHLQQPDSKYSLSHADVKKFAREPIQSALPLAAEVIANILIKMNMHILNTTNETSFITSDHPCIMFDPLFSSDYLALGCPSIEVSFPISPKQLVVFFWGNPNESREYAYTAVKENVINDFNNRARFSCEKYFITNKKL